MLFRSINQSYCEVSAIEAGIADLPLEWVTNTARPGERIIAPALSFAIRRVGKDELILFDLGIRKDWENISPTFGERMRELTFGISVPQDVIEGLAQGGARPEAVTHIVLSHLHFDHVGDPRAFPHAEFVLGGASRALLAANPDGMVPQGLLPAARTRFLDDPARWPPLGPFAHALDLFGDGAMYVVDAPGHVPGHINLLARTSPDGAWVLLAGDSAHDRRLLTGEAGIARHGPFGCAHVDCAEAEAHLARIRELMEMPRVRVLLAHDTPWWKENQGKAGFWPDVIQSL